VHLLVPWRQSAVVKDCHLEPVLSLDDGFSYCLDPGVELAMVQLRQSPESFGWEGLVARTYEESFGATVHDVSNPADAAGYDLLSRRPDGEERCIEVKGRRAIATSSSARTSGPRPPTCASATGSTSCTIVQR
jgi:hypothetical protein